MRFVYKFILFKIRSNLFIFIIFHLKRSTLCRVKNTINYFRFNMLLKIIHRKLFSNFKTLSKNKNYWKDAHPLYHWSKMKFRNSFVFFSWKNGILLNEKPNDVSLEKIIIEYMIIINTWRTIAFSVARTVALLVFSCYTHSSMSIGITLMHTHIFQPHITFVCTFVKYYIILKIEKKKIINKMLINESKK